MSVASSVKKLRFDGQVAIVTGSARGLGKEYAKLLASRGAKVVVNDFGGERSGESAKNGQLAANETVAEIKRRWSESEAVADFNSVGSEEGAQRLVESTLSRFGRVDILINNAGILRDKSFAKMTIQDWDRVYNVHLRGSFLVSHFCWPHMTKQEYGKIIMTSSTSGLYGNFGQANYSAAKMGLVGLSNTLSIEGARSNIKCNTIVPMASSRMTQDILPDDLAARLRPAYVAPLVGWLCHRDCQDTGTVVEAAGRWFGQYKLQRAHGRYLAEIEDDCNESDHSVEQVAASWNEICGFDERAKRVCSFGVHLDELLKTFEQSK